MASRTEVEAAVLEMYRQHLASFIGFAFEVLYPTRQLLPAWHVDLLADRLSRCQTRETRQLIVNLPPRSLKSFCTSVAFPAWVLGWQPDARILCISGNKHLASTLEEQTRQLMESDRYRRIFPRTRLRDAAQGIKLTAGGYRLGLTVNAPIMGLGADYVIVDDPLIPGDARDPQRIRLINQWFNDNVRQRLDDKARGVVIVVMQRLHPDDLTTHLLSRDQTWMHLSLPAIAMKDESFDLAVGGRVGRTKGQALNEGFESRASLRETLFKIWAAPFMAQYQQAPWAAASPDGYRYVDRGGLRKGVRWRPEHGYPVIVFGLRVPETDFVLFEVFGEGEDPDPPNQRSMCESNEEWMDLCAYDEEYRKKRAEEFERARKAE